MGITHTHHQGSQLNPPGYQHRPITGQPAKGPQRYTGAERERERDQSPGVNAHVCVCVEGANHVCVKEFAVVRTFSGVALERFHGYGCVYTSRHGQLLGNGTSTTTTVASTVGGSDGHQNIPCHIPAAAPLWPMCSCLLGTGTALLLDALVQIPGIVTCMWNMWHEISGAKHVQTLFAGAYTLPMR